jgi:uncharacterized protein (TIGR02246 family)
MPHRLTSAASFPLYVLTLGCALALGTACSNTAPGAAAGATTSTATAAPASNAAADEAAIRTLDSAWNKSAVDKNADLMSSYYATDAVLLAPGAPMAKGHDAIHTAIAGMFGSPGFSLTFAPDQVTAKGDLAYEIGSYKLTSNNKAGKTQTSTGKYVVVWGRQADGSWKAEVDAPTTTP